MKPILAGLALAAIAAGLGLWWNHERLYPSTDDAYVEAHILDVAPQVSGRVTQVAVAENDRVAKGDLLFRIDDKALRAAVDLARAQRREAEAAFRRQQALYRKNDIAKAALDGATATRDEAQAREKAAQQALARARVEMGDGGRDNAGVRAALARLDMAEIDLDHATVTAPIGGWNSQIDLQPGAVVSAGQVALRSGGR